MKKEVSICHSLMCLDLVSFPVLSRRLHSWRWPSVNRFTFQACDHASPRTQNFDFSVQRGGTSEQKTRTRLRLRLRFFLQKSTHIHQTRATTHDQLRHPCFGDHSRLVGLSCNLLHHLNQSIGEGHGKCKTTILSVMCDCGCRHRCVPQESAGGRI